jgi:S1-C subfamily serine protease
MKTDGLPLLRAIALLGLAAALVLAGVAIGSSLWPRIVEGPSRNRTDHYFRSLLDKDTNAPLSEIVQTACNAIVSIPIHPVYSITAGGHALANVYGPAFSSPRDASGFFISASGDLLTSTAAIPSEIIQVTVILNDGRKLPAAFVARDDLTGLVLLKVDAVNLSFLPFAETPPLPGDTIVSVNSPRGTGCEAHVASVSTNYRVGLGGLIADFQVEPYIPGLAAGSPIISTNGRILGMGIDPLAAKGRIADSRLVNQSAQMMVRGQRAPERLLGLMVDDLAPALAGAARDQGASVLAVQRGGRAAHAGLRAGDVITGINGIPVSGASELRRALDGKRGSLNLSLLRDSQSRRYRI